MIMKTGKIIMGIDGGATNCRVVLADENGHRISEARGGPSNIANDYHGARENILRTTLQALHALGCDAKDFSKIHGVLGIAGNNLGDFGAKLQHDLPFAAVQVYNDGLITFVGALGREKGAMAVLGTGSVFVANTDEGYKSVGGWGFLMGDEGGGAKLGYHIFERTIYANDGVFAHSDLTRQILGEFKGSVGHLIEAVKAMPPHEFGNYAPRVIDAAHKGDQHAKSVLEDAVHWIERQSEAVGFREDRAFCVLGGLGPIFLPMMHEKFQKSYVTPKGNALDGALQMALDAWGRSETAVAD